MLLWSFALDVSVRLLGAWLEGFALGSGRGHHATGFSPKPGLPAPAARSTFPSLSLRPPSGRRGGEWAGATGRIGWLTWLPPLPTVAVPSVLAVGLPPFACEVRGLSSSIFPKSLTHFLLASC